MAESDPCPYEDCDAEIPADAGAADRDRVGAAVALYAGCPRCGKPVIRIKHPHGRWAIDPTTKGE